MPNTQEDIYDFPKYYDLVYGSDWKAEYGFLTECFEHYLDKRPKRLFEPACGTGRLLFRFGKAGYEVVGIDVNHKAIAYCNQRLERHGLPATATVADMSNFELDQPVNAAFNMINSFRHLGTEQLAVKHMRCMRRAIIEGGIYVLGLHLSPLVGETCDEESWTASRGSLAVISHLWLVERNLAERYEEYAMRYDIRMPSRKMQINNKLRFRTYTADEFEKLINQKTDFEIEAIHDFQYELDRSFFLNESVEDAVFVLRAK